MDRNQSATRWSLIREQVKRRWSKLTDDDLDAAQGNLKYLTEMIQEKYGESRQAIDIQLKHLFEQENRAG